MNGMIPATETTRAGSLPVGDAVLGPSEQVVMPAGIAVDAREAVMRIAARDEALDSLLFDRAPQPSRLAQLLCVPPRALPLTPMAGALAKALAVVARDLARRGQG